MITLCGFRVLEAGYWKAYEHHGLSIVYDVLSHLPRRYCRDKFKKSIYEAGEKERDVAELEQCRRAYDPRGNWEFTTHRD